MFEIAWLDDTAHLMPFQMIYYNILLYRLEVTVMELMRKYVPLDFFTYKVVRIVGLFPIGHSV